MKGDIGARGRSERVNEGPAVATGVAGVRQVTKDGAIRHEQVGSKAARGHADLDAREGDRSRSDVVRVPRHRGRDRGDHRRVGDDGDRQHDPGRHRDGNRQDFCRERLGTATRREEGQTFGIYIVAVAALFFLAFAFFAVGQASAKRNSAQTAADAAALAAARATRDEVKDAFGTALKEGDLVKLGQLLGGADMDGARGCTAAHGFALENDAGVANCGQATGLPGVTLSVITNGTVGKSVIDGTEAIHAKAEATAVVEKRCIVRGKDGKVIKFACNGENLSIDPTASGFVLDLSDFFTVHLSK